MNRPTIRWLLFTLCLSLFLGAMLWVSRRTLDMEKDRSMAEQERLALWRMDAFVSSLLIRENARPPTQYQAFHSPDDLYLGKDNLSVAQGTALMPSPLLAEPPEFVHLHFELLTQNNSLTCTSPQVPTGQALQLATTWYAVTPQIKTATERMAQLQAILQKYPQLANQSSPPATRREQARADDSSVPSRPAEVPPPAASPKPTPILAANADQQSLSERELRQRASVTFASNEAAKSMNASPLLKNSAAPAPPLGQVAAEAKAVAGVADSLKIEKAPGIPSATPSTSAGSAVSANGEVGAAHSHTSPPSDFIPAWAQDELFLTRTASIDGTSRKQGVWIDWPKLRSRLLENIADLLPGADLIPISPSATTTDPLALVTLSVRLAPGALPYSITAFSPMSRGLLIAWACLLAAAAAIAWVLFKSIQLSERRGAFVSAVTHELRTPLTTFRMYSEMLADDVVADPDTRRQYLQTLCDESTRLTHLVENVLSYSRIERGRPQTRIETLTLAELWQRIAPRLKSRAIECGLDVDLDLPESEATVTVQTDPSAVEQILFNLTDNACKYAAPDCETRRVDIRIHSHHNQAILSFRDYGPGISAQQRKKLFQPFSKSATEAAHSAPGVGLGLALSRRLARELGGDLVFQPGPHGATFELTLPLV